MRRKPKEAVFSEVSHAETTLGDTEERTIRKGFNKIDNLIEEGWLDWGMQVLT